MKKIDLTYEETIKELEKNLDELEKGELSLDDSVDRFKKGIKLYNHCNKILKKVEGEIKILLEDEEEGLKEEDFNMEV